MIDTIKSAYQFIATLPPQFWAPVAGLLISWFGTQAIKFQLPDNLPDPRHRRAIRGAATLLGAIPTYALWPTHDATAAIWALLVGLASPTLYVYAMRILYHFYPWLEGKMSARPVIKYDKDGKAIGVRMDPQDPDDKTKYFNQESTQPKPPSNPP
jgi:hypothetical protein